MSKVDIDPVCYVVTDSEEKAKTDAMAPEFFTQTFISKDQQYNVSINLLNAYTIKLFSNVILVNPNQSINKKVQQMMIYSSTSVAFANLLNKDNFPQLQTVEIIALEAVTIARIRNNFDKLKVIQARCVPGLCQVSSLSQVKLLQDSLKNVRKQKYSTDKIKNDLVSVNYYTNDLYELINHELRRIDYFEFSNYVSFQTVLRINMIPKLKKLNQIRKFVIIYQQNQKICQNKTQKLMELFSQLIQ